MNSNNTLSFSLVSIWEMQIKIQLNKLRINLPLSEVIDRQQQVNGLQILPIELTHIFALEQLPNPHRDPFDRLLIAQALVTQIPILSVDIIFDRYPVQRLW
ncbi:type II toxin-antitoxin system VapC family toxin [Roseofilum capinflatum]|uniref:Type II toxin-antitoxin system VapC family toxin n=1 Tax=Roseofilum capinflatum BLCC-M114 TaxID=3022440 RepID=A0ABT7B6G5_9CYAN|nr:type II toxin-antitoxin system VapC family toxin [Roseofilum capinflatum]MDJ1174731.1 type II toxin-antitoxin system VapC family toxin [Roseofilum capinflatum BLCC-M114]